MKMNRSKSILSKSKQKKSLQLGLVRNQSISDMLKYLHRNNSPYSNLTLMTVPKDQKFNMGVVSKSLRNGSPRTFRSFLNSPVRKGHQKQNSWKGNGGKKRNKLPSLNVSGRKKGGYMADLSWKKSKRKSKKKINIFKKNNKEDLDFIVRMKDSLMDSRFLKKKSKNIFSQYSITVSGVIENKEKNLQNEENLETQQEEQQKNFPKEILNSSIEVNLLKSSEKLELLKTSNDLDNIDEKDEKEENKSLKQKKSNSPKKGKIVKSNRKIIILKKKKKKHLPLKKGSKIYKIKWFGNSKDFIKIRRYLILKSLLGRGTYAPVYEGRLLKGGQDVAVKVFPKKRQSSSDRRMIQREIDIILKISHPNIVKSLSVLEDSNSVYLAMENLGNTNLKKIEKTSSLSKQRIRFLMKGILKALCYLHSKDLCHRDLKLSNVMLKGEKPILIDFGMACSIRGVKDYLICGTKPYFAPEMIRQVGYSGDKIDVWCAGVIMYKLLSGVYPFGDKDDQDIEKRVLEKNPIYAGKGMAKNEISILKMMLAKKTLYRPTAEILLTHPYFEQEEEE